MATNNPMARKQPTNFSPLEYQEEIRKDFGHICPTPWIHTQYTSLELAPQTQPRKGPSHCLGLSSARPS